jgi:hypothetical protein
MWCSPAPEEAAMSTVLLVLLVVIVLAVLPIYPYSIAWGYWPGSVALLLLVVLLVLIFTGRL